jgi:hypothetical protein
MTRSRRGRWARFLSIVFGAAPFVFGLIRAVSTGYDLRMLWMALASFLGALLVGVVGRSPTRGPNTLLALSALTFVVTALLAGSTALLLGATAPAGVWGVAIVFALLWAASSAFDTLARSRPV